MTSPDFIEDCLVWRGRVLTGSCAHWCPEWDDLPIDETCPEWPCGCGFGDCKAICVLATTLEAAQARIAALEDTLNIERALSDGAHRRAKTARAEALEEAAKVADDPNIYEWEVAAAIRALKEKDNG